MFKKFQEEILLKGKLDCAFKYNPKKITHYGMGWMLGNGRKRQELTGKKDKKKGVNWGKGKKQNENWEV